MNIFARDIDGTGSMHACSKGDPGAVEFAPFKITTVPTDDGGAIVYLGRWPVGEVCYRLLRSQGDPKAWAATCRLPGLKKTQHIHADPLVCLARLEHVVQSWVSRLNEEPKK